MVAGRTQEGCAWRRIFPGPGSYALEDLGQDNEGTAAFGSFKIVKPSNNIYIIIYDHGYETKRSHDLGTVWMLSKYVSPLIMRRDGPSGTSSAPGRTFSSGGGC